MALAQRTEEQPESQPPSEQSSRGRQTIGAFNVPWGYEVWADGVYRLKDGEDLPADQQGTSPSYLVTIPTKRKKFFRRVTPRPIWIREIGRRLDDGEELIQLAWLPAHSNTPKYEWISRFQMAEPNTLTKLSRIGAPIRRGTADAVEDFLDRGLHMNAQTITSLDLAVRCGARETAAGWGWLVGGQWVGPPGTYIARDPRDLNKFSTAYRSVGQLQDWTSMFRWYCGAATPVGRWIVMSSFAAPLLRHIGIRTFVVHHWAKSGSSKSAALKMAMTVWGDFRKLVGTFNRTKKSFTEVFAYTDDFPVAFDELQSATEKSLSDLLYLIVNEQGRERAGEKGGLLESIDEWHSIAFMNGEEPIVGHGKVDLGGQANRVIQFNAKALESRDGERVHMWVNAQTAYGSAGLAFICALRNVLLNPNGAALLRKRWEVARDQLVERITEPSLRPRMASLAVTVVAGSMARQLFLDQTKDDAWDCALDDAVSVAELLRHDMTDRDSLTEMTLQLLRDHREQYKRTWLDLRSADDVEKLESGTYDRLAGIIGAGHHGDEVWVVQSTANNLLRKNDLTPARIWPDFRAEGILVCSGQDGRNMAPIKKFGKFRNRVYVMKEASFFPKEES
jgi:hypothetical protein